MTEISDRIRLIRKHFGLNQRQLGEAAGVTKSAVSQWERGETTPQIAPLLELQRNLNVNPEWVMSGRGGMVLDGAMVEEEREQYLTKGPETIPRKTVPVVGTAEGGPDREWDDLGYPPGYGTEYVDAPSKDPNAYALLASGNSMYPRMRPGEAILVEPSHDPQPGDEVVVKFTNGNTMVKIYSAKRGNRVFLDSIGDHETIVVPEDEIEFMHCVACVFRPSFIKQR